MKKAIIASALAMNVSNIPFWTLPNDPDALLNDLG